MTFSSDFPDLLAELGESEGRGGRQRFLDALTADIQIAMMQAERLALVLVDIRKFMSINLSHGYACGDEVLLRLPGLLKEVIRKASAVERLGDNLFGVVIPAVSSPALLPIAAEKIRRKLQAPLHVSDHTITLECHITAAVYPEEGQTADDLLLTAERTLVDVKLRKFSDVAIPVLMQHAGRARWQIERQLRGAIDRGELELFYQPKIRLRDRLPASAEALVRWNSSELGMVRPDEFIGVAEESSLINQITEWALRTAIRVRSEIIGRGDGPSVAVNVSASDIYDCSIVHNLESVLAIWGVAPEHLTLEVTESVIMDNPDIALRNLELLRKLGVKIALDDFGTGYSSLAYFKTLPIDELKIDKSFILNMRQDSDDAVLVEAIINLAHQFNLSVVAEGVEDVQTLRQLDALGCDYVQGYHFSQALPQAKFRAWLDAYRADAYWSEAPPPAD